MESNAPAKPAYAVLREQKDFILKRWKSMAQERIQATQSNSTAALVDFLPLFLDHLIDALKPSASHKEQLPKNEVSFDHGFQRSKLKHYTVDQVVAEYALLEEIILDVVHREGLVTAQECSIIAKAFMDACSNAASAFVRSAEQSEIQFKRLVEEAKDVAILILDPDGIIQTWNAGAERINQFSEADVIGRHFRMLFRPEDQKLGRPEKNLKEALTSGRHVEQWWRVKKDGSVWWAEVVLSTIHSPSGKVIGLSKTFHDLTEKKRTEDQLRLAKVTAEAANRMKSTFLANMSHEIRTPLGIILGIAEVLKQPELTAQQREELFRMIDRNGKVLLRLIDDILDFTKVEAGKLELQFTIVNIQNLLKDLIQAFEPQAQEKHIFLSLEVHPDVLTPIQTDEIRLRQILTNLISNAVKFTEHGGVRIIVHSLHSEKFNGFEIVISDTGPGIPAENIDRIFGEFSQADPSVTRKYGGAGLGLALSRKLARELGGDLELVDCSEKIGCTFRVVVVDHSNIRDISQAVNPSNTRALGTNPSHFPHLQATKLLFIEDSHEDQLLVQQILSQFGVQVEIVPNVEEGVQRVFREKFDAILLDLHHQLEAGLRASEELRGHGFVRPIVAISDREIEDRKPALTKYFDDYLPRPINSVELLNLLEKWMSENHH